MSSRDKIKAVLCFLAYGASAYFLCRYSGNNIGEAAKFEVILCFPYFMIAYENGRKLISQMSEMSFLETIGLGFYAAIRDDVTILMTLSLTIGNTLANFGEVKLAQAMIIIGASPIIVILGCIIGTSIGYLKQKI